MSATPRSFTLLVHTEVVAAYAIDLRVATNGSQNTLARFEGATLDRLRPAVLTAVVSSKQPRTALSASRKVPIPLSEDAGVRLALTAMAVKPLSKPTRVEEIRQGIDAMTSEEALYWYANCTGTRATRALRALRTLLAEA